MQILITDTHSAKVRQMQLSGLQMTSLVVAFILLMMLLSGVIYHAIFLTAVRENWPVLSQVVRFVTRDENAQRDRVLRDNLDGLASKLGELQARVVKVESAGERVTQQVGLKPEDLRPKGAASKPGAGGPFVPATIQSAEDLKLALQDLDARLEGGEDMLTLLESRLLEQRLMALIVPSSKPMEGPVGSGFGYRSDPFSGRPALHTGLDFPADIGTPIQAAAGGVVLNTEPHPQYGQLVEIDHGSALVTRYAHVSKALVKPGEIVKRGQVIAQVGNTGRSTGPHLHFEVLLQGIPQDPQRFLARTQPPAPVAQTAGRPNGGPVINAPPARPVTGLPAAQAPAVAPSPAPQGVRPAPVPPGARPAPMPQAMASAPR